MQTKKRNQKKETLRKEADKIGNEYEDLRLREMGEPRENSIPTTS